jgi:glycosyltransferase involved in cell wall biosynthesis
MKIAVLYATNFADVSPGGIQQYVRRIGSAAPKEWQIDYFGLGAAGRLPRDEDQYVAVANPSSKSPNNYRYLRGLGAFEAQLQGYDAIVAHRPEYLAANDFRVPTALVLHGGTLNAWRTGRRAFGVAYTVAETLACKRANVVLSVDPAGLIHVNRAISRKIVSLRVPASEEFREVSGILGNVPHRLITTCRLSPEKRVDRILRLAAMVNWPVVIIGDGECSGELRDLASELEIDAYFTGYLEKEAIAEEYGHGGVFVLGSVFEGYPLAAVEALVAGLPCIAVESRCLDRLRDFGARQSSSVDGAAELLRNVVPVSRAERDNAWRMHDPAALGAHFWSEIAGIVHV